MSKKLLLAAALWGLAGIPAEAATFNFFWSADPALDPNIVEVADPTLLVTGVIDIDALAGQAFTENNILSINLFVSGVTLTSSFSLTLSDPANLDLFGSISLDGLTASLGDFYAQQGAGYFGCAFFGCEQGFVYASSTGSDQRILTYNSPANALASYKLTNADPISAVPIPAALPLLAAGLGALAIMGRRKRKNATA